MANGLNFGGKRELLARGLIWSGTSFLLSHLPPSNSLLVLNYHRIGNSENDLFDPGVFSATPDQFDDQIAYLKHHLSLVTLDEALAFIDGTDKEKSPRCRVLITFDDGYLDNYQIAFPILRSHGAQGVFFLATSMVGSCAIPWWDQIAYLMKTARKRQFSLSYPADFAVNLERNGLEKSLNTILKLYKRPDNLTPKRFLRELAEACEGKDSPERLRRFLNWEEAREMIGGGMEIGSHAHSHQVLSQLEGEKQRQELDDSRRLIMNRLGVEVRVLAYPVGHKISFTDQTRRIARESGYKYAFSHYGGANIQGKISSYDVKRTKICLQSRQRFQTRSAVGRFTGLFWP
ncbi:MAG: polysaccharide deacetylase family protein [Terracidiphilus sp.]